MLAFQLQWQQIKMSNLHKKYALYWRITQQTILKSSVKIPIIRQQLKPIFIFPMVSLWKLKIAIATKVHMQQ